ncbi:MAG: hypothetical protein H6934_13880 [Burkholderiaceae bacterium]|nr:hypothetical protein [Burkholderiaceae bacterium]
MLERIRPALRRAPTALAALVLSGCVVYPAAVHRPAAVAPAGVIVPPGVVYVAPGYPAPGVGWIWSYHGRRGWGWHHRQRGWHRGWR